MKLIGRLVVVLGIVAVLPAGFVVVRDMAKAKEHDTKIEDLTRARKELRDELRDVNLEQRGYTQSISSMPDSVRKGTSGEIMATNREFEKRRRIMDQDIREMTRLITRNGTKKAELLADTRRFAIPLGGGGIALMLIGFVLIRRGGR